VTQERYNMAADIGLSGGNVASVYLMATAQVWRYSNESDDSRF